MITVIETKTFIARAERLLSGNQRAATIDFISANPEAGAHMQGTGGVRKLRIPSQGRGKSGGARVIYYFYNEDIPVFLLDLFANNEKGQPDQGPAKCS